MKNIFHIINCLLILLVIGSCKKKKIEEEEIPVISNRIFSTSFESIHDFNGFYIAPQNHMSTASHDTSREYVRSGIYAHKGWIWAANPPSTATENNNHRGYPTVQLYKTSGGAYKTPLLTEFWVWLDVTFTTGEWFSLATFARSSSDTYWDGVLVNVSDAGIVHLMHVPTQGQGNYIFQTTTVTLPMRTWVKISVELDMNPSSGYAKVWQDDVLVSHALVEGGDGTLPQAHFGLYAPPSMSAGVIYNEDLIIYENKKK